jgi:hypothetical protein
MIIREVHPPQILTKEILRICLNSFLTANLQAVAAKNFYEAGFSTSVHLTTCAELK